MCSETKLLLVGVGGSTFWGEKRRCGGCSNTVSEGQFSLGFYSPKVCLLLYLLYTMSGRGRQSINYIGRNIYHCSAVPTHTTRTPSALAQEVGREGRAFMCLCVPVSEGLYT